MIEVTSCVLVLAYMIGRALIESNPIVVRKYIKQIKNKLNKTK